MPSPRNGSRSLALSKDFPSGFPFPTFPPLIVTVISPVVPPASAPKRTLSATRMPVFAMLPSCRIWVYVACPPCPTSALIVLLDQHHSHL